MNETAGRQMTAEGLQVLITDADMDMHPLLADRPAQRNDFGINLFLEKYQAYITKIDNDANNKGRYDNFLNDLGIREKYRALPVEDQQIVKEFLSALGNLEQTSVSDSVQMIIRDLLFHPNGKPKPYIIYNAMQAWEYKDLLPDDTFDINPFDIEIENLPDGRLAYERLTDKLLRIKSTLALFDDSGSLWDLFCENTTIRIIRPVIRISIPKL